MTAIGKGKRNHNWNYDYIKSNIYRYRYIFGCIGLLLIVGTALAVSSDLGYQTPTARPDISHGLYLLINENRHIYDVPSVRTDTALETEAQQKSFDYVNWTRDGFRYSEQPWDRENAMIIPKLEYDERFYSSPTNVVDHWMNSNKNYRTDSLNKDYQNIGIGVVDNGRSYYIIIKWS